MPEDKPSPEPEGPPAPAKGEKPERAPRKKAEEKEEPKAPKGPKKLEGVKEDFRYIVRMANTDLDGTRAVAYSLTAIPGVGIRVSEAVADLAGVSKTERLGNLSEEQTDKIEATFGNLGEAFPHWMVNRPDRPDRRGDEESRPRRRPGEEGGGSRRRREEGREERGEEAGSEGVNRWAIRNFPARSSNAPPIPGRRSGSRRRTSS